MENPFPYPLCDQTVTIYTVKDGQVHRRVAENCFYSWQDVQMEDHRGLRLVRKFLLIQPGSQPVRPGDKICPGEGPEISPEDWDSFLPVLVPGLCVAAYAAPWYWEGRVCHYEAGRK